MEIYKDINRDSGVKGFEINADSITVWFDGTIRSYTYSYISAGSIHVETMKKLAVSGDGLNAYINRHVKFKYVR
ncbi:MULTISPECIES: hypothetical protein [Aeromonas]|uniref:hypothetical protein n=1 Tax=Aeromonas TaxID=642 RepID=UPI0009BCFA5E|nr:hypothetical protein [Aeromonas salmonicida]MDF8327372.1 hypothetical protein [Aeromonas salmonicida]RSM21404.1 hypothetical protein C5B76_21410 [Aeromonas salmonicida]